MTCRELVAIAVLLAGGAVRARAQADDGPAAAAAPRDTPGASDAVDRRLTERLIRLADHHYRAGEYYRAISAYEEIALFTGDDAVKLAAAIRIAMSYHHGHQL